MKISIHTSMTDPEERMDPWKESLSCYKDFADEVVITGEDWPEEFLWEHIGNVFHEGFEKSTGDWAIRMDLDYLFHENDFEYIKNFLKSNSDYPAIAFPRYQFFSPDKYQIIALVCIAVNKKKFPEIKLNGGGDLCMPTLNNKLIEPRNMPISKAPIWNYEMMFKTKDIIAHERTRFAKAWYKQFGNWGVFGGPDKEIAFDAWIKLIEERYRKHIHYLDFDKHPKYIKDKLVTLQENQFGFDCFGLKNKIKPDIVEYLRHFNRKYIKKIY